MSGLRWIKRSQEVEIGKDKQDFLVEFSQACSFDSSP